MNRENLLRFSNEISTLFYIFIKYHTIDYTNETFFIKIYYNVIQFFKTKYMVLQNCLYNFDQVYFWNNYKGAACGVMFTHTPDIFVLFFLIFRLVNCRIWRPPCRSSNVWNGWSRHILTPRCSGSSGRVATAHNHHLRPSGSHWRIRTR